MMNLELVIYYFRFYIIKDVTARTMFLSQETYVYEILDHFGIQNSKKVDTFMVKKDILIYTNSSSLVIFQPLPSING